jgi:hypothetical protein
MLQEEPVGGRSTDPVHLSLAKPSFIDVTVRTTRDAPVDADGGQIQNGRRTAHYVEGHPSIAQDVAQLPLGVVYLDTRTQV